ncbi:hypothetical protein ACIRO1_45420 [Streptomyces sp. NPDC102381]|uniref:hypothetical protein n=1 Tax=Streptomyces sp. NPDC102381 TaxID=3366164 RepID=UPI00381766B6
MPQLEYRGAADLPAAVASVVWRDREERRWRVTAMVVHHDPDTDRIVDKTLYLRPYDGGGTEWEISLDQLRMTAEVDQ